ncbi:MAG: ZIP family metal transporter [Candidatus Sungbacteria bacterium]|nr:ZIP family metal transporter [Candidatus Sungbacteria bacterium]
MSLFLYIFLASAAASLVSLVGGVLAVFNEEKVRHLSHYVISFAVGALLSVAVLDLIPEAAELGSLDGILPYVLAGVLLFFLVEKFLFWYHCHEGECPVHTYSYLILWGDFLHNFIDGIIIALTFLADVRLGALTTIAVILHEIPQEIGDFGILIHGGFSRTKALLYNFLSSISVIFGAVLMYVAGAILEPFLPVGIALTAGAFIYLAAVDLMPELHEATGVKHAILQIIFMALGSFLVILPGFLFGVH